MSRCRLCNFCRETDTPSEFQSDYHLARNMVKYRPELNDTLCTECFNHVQENRDYFNDLKKFEDKDIEKELIDADGVEEITDSEEALALPIAGLREF